MILENNKEIELTLLHPSLTPSGLCFYFPEPVMIKAKSPSITVYFPFHSKQELQKLRCFLSWLSWTSGLLQTELFAEAPTPMVSVTSSSRCRGKRALPGQGSGKAIHTLLMGCNLSKQMSWLLQLELFGERWKFNMSGEAGIEASLRTEHGQYLYGHIVMG